MIREELVEGAISFLQDPTVASAPIEQRIAFLRSKNLTQEEVDASLARVGQTAQAPPQTNTAVQYRSAPPQYAYQQQPYWTQPPPEVPRRDWRDWFIMATVVGGAGYAMYWSAKQYIIPLIAPPTPPQLEQDKAAVDASFDKAFALLDQLATDTQELKDSEKARTERLDAALAEIEGVISKLKTANENKDLESKRLARELDDIRDQIPRALEKEKERMDGRLSELASEMKSLKTLMAGRVGAPARNSPGFPGNSTIPQSIAAAQQATPVSNGVDTNGVPPQQAVSETPAATTTTIAGGSGTGNANAYGRILGSGKAQIPSWQLAAKKTTEEAKAQDVSQSGTASTDALANE